MLSPDDQVLLTDALRPPPDFDIDHAVATTYSLTLESILVAPMSFAMASADDIGTAIANDPITTLDAVQRHIDRTTVFVQAGGIHIPVSHSRIFAFLEDSVVEVDSPDQEGSFHPKMWAVRYVNDDNEFYHRVIVTSRNLTQDTSWDTVLVLEEASDGVIDAAPAADFIRTLPEMSIRPASAKRRHAVDDLARTLSAIRLSAPPPFTRGELVPMGLGEASWSFPQSAVRTLVISPFLAATQLEVARAAAPDAMLISRADSMNELGRKGLASWDTFVLHTAVDQPDDEDTEPDMDSSRGAAPWAFETGLHAKTAIIDGQEGESLTVTGSANFTQSAWTRNVEFNVVLHGPTRTTGVDEVLSAGDGPVGLSSIIEPYSPERWDPETDAERAIRYQIENFHRRLARSKPALNLSIIDQDSVTARLVLEPPDDELSETTQVWLYTVDTDVRNLRSDHPWTVAPASITTFLAVETTATYGAGTITRRCVITCELTGDAVDRRKAALAAILSNPASVLRYLALLLGLDPVTAPVASEVKGDTDSSLSLMLNDDSLPDGGLPPVVLFEPLMHATRQPRELAKIAHQIDELRSIPDADEKIPPEFLMMWDVVLESVSPGGLA
ncbi:phospholipase D family protein [Brevibacterium yomogidense]|uniref:phospholipase D family protein n=1 Tax=Brevibacterium yomogidense TaxID=946573 RepID=UPI0018DF3AEA|nr:phospholipase D family protein [Brevibacterium yomogidense]